MRNFSFVIFALVLATLSSCGSDPGDELVHPEGCNPIAASWDCLLPYPSDHFLVPDDSMPSGRRVELPPAAFVPYRAARVDFFAERAVDGFSMAAPILAFFPVALDPDPLVRWDEDVLATTRGEGPTVLVDSSTGERVPHFAELDSLATSDERRALILRPLVRLSPETRYVVGLRQLVDLEGALVEPPEEFRRLRDGAARGATSERFEAEVFPVLEEAGFLRPELQLAWDFTTGSDRNVRGDMLAARDTALAALAASDYAIEIVEVIEGEDLRPSLRDTTARQIELQVRGPSIVTSPVAGEASLRRDANGEVVRQGDVTFPVTVLVPLSVAGRTDATAARLIQYGHGFFGRREELVNGFMDDFANDHGFVAMAADWWGMMADDRDALIVGLAGSAPEDLFPFVERTHQGILNFMILAGIAEALAELEPLTDEHGPLIDTSATYFWGNSMGHILGGVFAALDPTVERAVLGVGGANFSLIMHRSRAFMPLRLLIDFAVNDELDRQKFGALLQVWLDRIDPLTYAGLARTSPLPGAPSKRFLIHTAPGDDAVTALAAELHARELGVPLLLPSPFDPPLLDRAESPSESALVEIDYGEPVIPTPEPPGANPIHEAVRRNPSLQAQVDAFLAPDGEVVHTCDGPCDPE